jgi:hypothetical protein
MGSTNLPAPRLPDKSSTSLTARVAAFFRAHPHRWIDGRIIAGVGGIYASRTRISECRRPPFNLSIENRVRRVTRPDRQTFRVSEYRFVPPTPRVPQTLPFEAGATAP